MRVLLLGGTAEARNLAGALVGRGDDVLTSLAGSVSTPLVPAGGVRVGSIGGVAGLVALLQTWRADALVDATHPFAAGVTAIGFEAAASTGVPLVVLRRPAWSPVPADNWTPVENIAAAADLVRDLPNGCAFLTTGRRGLAAFAPDPRPFLVRTIEAPTGELPQRMTLVQDRGPYTVEDETNLMRSYDVTVLVTKNSGGTMTAAKLTAARDLGVPVVMVERPALPVGAGPVDSVEAVLDQLSPVLR